MNDDSQDFSPKHARALAAAVEELLAHFHSRYGKADVARRARLALAAYRRDTAAPGNESPPRAPDGLLYARARGSHLSHFIQSPFRRWVVSQGMLTVDGAALCGFIPHDGWRYWQASGPYVNAPPCRRCLTRAGVDATLHQAEGESLYDEASHAP